MNTNHTMRNSAVRRTVLAAGGVILASALAVAPASADALTSSEQSASTEQSAEAAEESMEAALEKGSLEVPGPDGFTVKQDGDGGATLTSKDGESTSLAATITAGSGLAGGHITCLP